jgi:hypothetical protein
MLIETQDIFFDRKVGVKHQSINLGFPNDKKNKKL